MSKALDIVYVVKGNIQHLPPVLRLQTLIPAPILVYKRSVLEHIQSKYPDLAERTHLTAVSSEVKRYLTKHKVRVAVMPAFTSLRRSVEVQIFHGGLSDKTHLETPVLSLYDLILFPGKKSVDKVEKANLLDKIIQWDIVGYPKFDPLINNQLEYEKVFNNDRATILYAPTWISATRPNANGVEHRFSPFGESSLPVWGVDMVKEVSKEHNLIVKFHSKIFESGDGIHTAMSDYVKKHNLSDRVAIIYDDNILPYMDQADIMVSDISTACYEWFHFNRPIVFANPSPENYRPENDISKNTFAWQAGDVLYKVEDILPTLAKNLEHDAYSQKRNEIFNYSVFSPDGHATSRQADKILEIYQKNSGLPYCLFSIMMRVKHIFRRFKLSMLKMKYPIRPD